MSPHMKPYLVVFRDWQADAGNVGRSDWVQHQHAATDAQTGQLRDWINSVGLEDQLGRIAKPTVFGSVGIVATEELAGKVRALRFVKAVIPG